MTPRQAAAHRRTIDAARAVERASQYGIDARSAVHDFEEARARLRTEQRRAVS
ncbi:hypothetical protein ACQPZX_41545 [Actinoplanes sp. CA-142083]|uniref:hypothetical protein n=1 Tax=Actinoplanes sp. CA-142083 TaxID=3239903 RepID=UPI003D8EED22